MGQDIEPFFVCSQEVYGTGDCILGSFFREGRKPYIFQKHRRPTCNAEFSGRVDGFIKFSDWIPF